MHHSILAPWLEGYIQQLVQGSLSVYRINIVTTCEAIYNEISTNYNIGGIAWTHADMHVMQGVLFGMGLDGVSEWQCLQPTIYKISIFGQ